MPPSGKTSSRTCVTSAAVQHGTGAGCPAAAGSAAGISVRAGAGQAGPAGGVADEVGGVELGEQRPRRRRPAAGSTQSLPSSRRRAVSQPSPMIRATPGRIRLCGRAVEHVAAVRHARRRAPARPGRGRRRQQPRVGHRPRRAPAAGPPRRPGRCDSRTWVHRRGSSTANSLPAVARQRRRWPPAASSRRRPARRAPGTPRPPQRLDRGVRRVVAGEVARCRRRRRGRRRARRAGRSPSRAPGVAPAAGLPAVVDLALVAERVRSGRPGGAGLIRFSPLGEELVVGRRPRRRRARRRGEVGQAANRRPAWTVRSCALLGSAAGPRGARRSTCAPRSQVSRTTPASAPAGVRGDRVAVVQPRRVDDERLVRGEERRVGVVADRDPALAPQPDQRGRALAPSSATTSASACPRGRACGPDRRQAELQRGDPAPGRPKSPMSSRLSSGVHGEWSRDHAVDQPVGQPLPQQLAVGRLADRRAALELGGAVRDLLGGEGQVVRAGLRGDPHAVAPRAARASAARPRWTGAGCAPARPVRRAASITCGDRARSRPRAAGRRGSPRYSSPCAVGARDRSRRRPRRARSAGASKSRMPPAPAELPGRRAAGTRRRRECSRKHLKPNTPASCSGRSSAEVAGDRAAPEADVDLRHCPSAAARLTSQRRRRRRSAGCS